LTEIGPHLIAHQFTYTSYTQEHQHLYQEKNMSQTQAVTPPKSVSPSKSRVFQSVYGTPDRVRFFDAFHAKPPEQTIRAFILQHQDQKWCPSGNTCRNWIQQEAESAETPLRRPQPKQRGGRPLNQAAKDQVEIMARGPRELRLRDWQFHAEAAGVSDGTLRRYCKRRKPPVLRSERLPIQKVYNKETAVGYHWIFHEKGYRDGIRREPWEIAGNAVAVGSSAAAAPPQALVAASNLKPQAHVTPSNFYEYVGERAIMDETRP
jgi:hypothetical protein